VRESLLAFLAGRYLAAVVMLGMAAERCLDLLIAAFSEAIADQTRKGAFESALKGATRSIKRRSDMLCGELLSLSLPAELLDDLDVQMSGLINIVRNARNDAGHPTVRTIDRDTAHANLLLFPQICKRIYQLINHFGANRV
jgi:hypothetical protein